MDENLVLVERVKKGDDEAFGQLLKNHHRMIYKIINGHNLDRGDYTIDRQELYQEASLALYDAVFSYEEGRNVKFSSYAYIVIRGRVINILRNYTNIYKEEMYSLDNECFAQRYLMYVAKNDPVSYHREVEFWKDLEEFMQCLDPQDRQILMMRGDRLSYREIADHLKINTKHIDNRLMVLRKRIGRELLEE